MISMFDLLSPFVSAWLFLEVWSEEKCQDLGKQLVASMRLVDGADQSGDVQHVPATTGF